MYNYAIIGSGKQGTSSAYDIIKNGEAGKIYLVDGNLEIAKNSAELLNKLTDTDLCIPLQIEASNSTELKNQLKDVDSIISGVPYYFNLELTKVAIDLGANFCDFGGNTDVVKQQINLNNEAVDKNISIIPDCGMDPGMNISFIQYLTEVYDKLDIVKSYGAGLLQNPKPPWNYGLSFHINGLTNEYYGNALFLRNGKVAEVPCLTEYEILDFPEPLEKLEAAVTSGGLSTLPYELEGKVNTLENKTLRYLGHWERFKAYSDLGLFEETPIEVDGQKIIPRNVYHTLLAPKLNVEELKDICIIKIFGEGTKDGKIVKTEIELIDYYDNETGFTSMQRLTGWHASIISILSAKGKIKKGAVAVDQSISGSAIIDELRKRGINIKISIKN